MFEILEHTADIGFRALFRALAAMQLNAERLRTYLEAVYPQKDKEREQDIRPARWLRVTELFEKGDAPKIPASHTLWGAYNTVARLELPWTRYRDRRVQVSPYPTIGGVNMKRRRFLGKSIAAGMVLSGSEALKPVRAARAAQAQPSDLPSKFTPAAYAVRRSAYSPFATSDYYTFADDLVLEHNRPGKPHQGKVLAAIQPHSDDVPLYCGGTVVKLIDEGYTGYLIRISNDEAAGRTLGYGVVQNEIDNHEVAKALGCKKAYSFYYRNHRMDDDAEIEIRARLIFLFRLLRVNTILTMDPYDHYDENPDHLVVGRAVEAACWMAGGSRDYPEHLKAGLKTTSVREKYYHARSPQGHNLTNRLLRGICG